MKFFEIILTLKNGTKTSTWIESTGVESALATAVYMFQDITQVFTIKSGGN